MKNATSYAIEPSVDISSTPGAPDEIIAGRYERVGALPAPGPFTAYEVRDLRDDMTLLLTQVPDEVAGTSHGMARVEAAVRDASRLRHPNLVVPVDLVDDGGRYFVVEPLPAADRLAALPGDPVLAAPEALQAVREITDALASVHDAGVVHGTVGPTNVLLSADGSPRLRLSGFALGSLLPEGGPFPAALVSQVAPELFAGHAADVRTDVFGIGLILFTLFEGRPFLSGDPRDVEELLRHGTGPLVPRFSGAVPAGLSSLVSRAVRRAAESRHQKMAHVRADLDACLRAIAREPIAPARPRREVAPPPAAAASEPVAAPPPPSIAPAEKTQPRKKATLRARLGRAKAPKVAAPPIEVITPAQAVLAVEPEAAPKLMPSVEAPAPVEAAPAVEVPAPGEAAAPVAVAAPVVVAAPVAVAAPAAVATPVEIAAPVAVPAPVVVPAPVTVAASVEVAPPVQVAASVEVPAPAVAPTVVVEAPRQVAPADPGRMAAAPVGPEPTVPPAVVERASDARQHPPVVGKVLLASMLVGICWGLILAFWPSQVIDAPVAPRPVAVAGSPDFIGPMPRPVTAKRVAPAPKAAAKVKAPARAPRVRVAPAGSVRTSTRTTAR